MNFLIIFFSSISNKNKLSTFVPWPILEFKVYSENVYNMISFEKDGKYVFMAKILFCMGGILST